MVIVIDPGHGGENEGTIEHLKGDIEKEMTLKTAGCLYNELKEYEGAEVWIPSEEPYSKEGMDLAIPLLHAFDSEGIFIRGAKTKQKEIRVTEVFEPVVEKTDHTKEVVIIAAFLAAVVFTAVLIRALKR